MATNQSLEDRVAALEQQAKPGPVAGAADGSTIDPTTVQAMLTGMLTAQAASQSQGAQGLASGATGQEAQGIFGFNPTKYDSIFWCKSRFMCNPQSISCLC
jgi:hypothetical protein